MTEASSPVESSLYKLDTLEDAVVRARAAWQSYAMTCENRGAVQQHHWIHTHLQNVWSHADRLLFITEAVKKWGSGRTLAELQAYRAYYEKRLFHVLDGGDRRAPVG